MTEAGMYRENVIRGVIQELTWRLPPDADGATLDVVTAIGVVAADLVVVDANLHNFGGGVRDVRLHIGLTESLLTGLHLLGPANIDGCVAETILADALQTRMAILEQTPVAGYA